MTVRHTRRSTDENIMEVSKDGSAPAAILRYIYPGVTPKNGRIVTVAGDGGSAPLEMRGAEIASALREDGVDTSRWRLRYYHKAHEGWKLLDLETTVAFTPPDQTRLEIALEPADPHPSAAAGATRVDTRDGFFGIGIVGGKNETNQGTLWRSAWQLGAAFTFTVGARFEKTSADTTKTWTSLPAYAYEDWATFAESQPHAAAWVAVEMGGTPLEEFEHPDRAVYVLGSEDNGLPSSVLRACAHHVSLPTGAEGRTASYNVAVSGSLVLFDRMAKRGRARGAAGRFGEVDDLPGGRAGVDSAKPSQLNRREG